MEFVQYIVESFQQARNANRRTKAEEAELADTASIYKPFKSQGWSFESSIHAASQSLDRRPEFEFNDWRKLHLNVVHELGKKRVFLDKFVLFFSKSLNQGYVARVDFKKKHIKIITVLPKGKGRPKDGTSKFVVENLSFPVEHVE